ncbi:anthranilate phosphoribosyltransferase [Acetobacteraceae bacterium ESL0709]|nr:anthranilate phosphoribosyltransferase [Acetobacteraceae bacterium ESL0697]MDF7677921.1 anthranilate phosphoribosyltransferase [Acetobacteraceae bacterium ESL0709]
MSGQPLSDEESEAAFEEIMKGQVPESQLASFLTALYMRGETKEELLGAVKAVRRHMRRLEHVPENTIDVCGTGGDGLGTLNVSTAVSFVLAGLGVPVAKHGNRALSSLSGATDVLEALGIPSESDIEKQEKRLREDGIAFLAAPHHHPSMKFALPVRKALGFRTLFNLLGPLCNPAQVKRQLVGVFDGQWCEPIAQVLGALGGTHIWAVHGRTDEGGIDEITLAGPTDVVIWEEGKTRSLTLEPEMAGLPRMPVHLLRGGGAESNAQRMRALFEGETGCYRDTVLFNAAVALHIAGKGVILDEKGISSEGLRANIRQAAYSLDEGLALKALGRVQKSFLPVA